MRPALCDAPSSRHMREYYLRCLVESLLTDRLREARTEGTVATRGETLAHACNTLVVWFLFRSPSRWVNSSLETSLRRVRCKTRTKSISFYIQSGMYICMVLLSQAFTPCPTSSNRQTKPYSNGTGTAAADIEVTVETGGGDAAAEAAAVSSSSPLCNPASTAHQRNAYLRATGVERMKQVRGQSGVGQSTCYTCVPTSRCFSGCLHLPPVISKADRTQRGQTSRQTGRVSR